jgi:DNA-binding transcriptional regulator YdaS (Cro superfamily)
MTDHLAAEKEALRRAADALGGQAALASACGLTDRRSVWPWFNDPKRRVPAERCPSIERATRAVAASKGDPSLIVTCEELCHDVDWGVLREQTAHEAEPAKAA